MARSRNQEVIWSFGLGEAQKEAVRSSLGQSYQMQNWLTGIAPTLMDYEKAQPCLSIFSPAGLKSLMELPELAVRHLELLPKMLMLDEGYSQEDLEFAIDSGVAEIIRPPYSKEKMQSKVRRAQEIEAVHSDVLRMSKEIILEREILERKNDALNFLVEFLTSTSISLRPEEILEMVAEKFGMLFPVRSVQAALWNCKDKTGATDIFISATEGSESFKVWVGALRDAVQLARPDLNITLNITPLDVSGQENQDDKWRDAHPSDGQVITLPLSMDERQFGVLLVLTDTVRTLSRDQALALNSALRHLALTLKNAQHFKILKQHAEYDGLTGLYNRRNFEQRIRDEVERAARYGYPLSVIFADLDHFKQINDLHGHLAGDAVLKEFASILARARRSSDYVARYGGEEFMLVLPHTSARQAYLLAERLRKEVAKHEFVTGCGDLRLTISQGVAELGGGVKNTEMLINEADRALYHAKNAGRNRTVNSASDSAKLAV